jgi:3-methyladenine DNA glycosylase AlkD
MNKTEVLRQLESYGTAQNRKVYARHGMTGPMFGVSYANLGKLRRQIKVDHALAEQLWATGNHDARVLATMIADPARTTARMLDAWVKEAGCGGCTALSNLAAESPVALARVEKWTRSKDEWVGAAGWHTLASLARDHDALSDEVLAGYVDRIEDEIHSAKNRTRYAMNNALISIGIRNPKLEKRAIAAAKRIGKVEVDHGETSCKTPDAVSYIRKAVAHRANKKSAKKKRAKKSKSASAAAG